MTLKKILLATSLSFLFVEESRAQNITHAPRIDVAPIGTLITGEAVRNVDGDTFHLQNANGRYIIRLWGVNAPERRKPFYSVASAFMRAATFNTTLSCTVMNRDRYARVVAQCRNAQGDLGEQIVAAGLARDYRRFSRGAYCRHEVSAQQQRIGLWQDVTSQPSDRARCP